MAITGMRTTENNEYKYDKNMLIIFMNFGNEEK